MSEKKEFFVETPVGTLHTYASIDPNYPGVYVDLKREGITCEAPLLLLDYSHTEYPECLDEETAKKGVLTCKMWNDLMEEDFETKAGFRNIDEFFESCDGSAFARLLNKEVDRVARAYEDGIQEHSGVKIRYRTIRGTEQETVLFASKRLDTEEGKQELIDHFENAYGCISSADRVFDVEILATDADPLKLCDKMEMRIPKKVSKIARYGFPSPKGDATWQTFYSGPYSADRLW